MNVTEKANETRPRTVEEFAALPITGFGVEVHELTEADRANGYIMIRDRRVSVSGPSVRSVEIPFEPEGFIAHMVMGDYPESYIDEDGVRWRLALHESGKWFRRQA